MASIGQIIDTESGSSVRSKINLAIVESNKVDDKIGSLSDDTDPQLSASLKANSHSIQESKGVDVASATNTNVLGGGNYFVITGTTNINAIISDVWTSGAVIRLKFEDILTITHNATVSSSNKAIFLQSQTDFITTTEDILELQYDGTLWREVNNLTKESDITNIVAKQGVGLAASKPVTGLTIGDIYVSTDSLLKFTATGTTTWDTGVSLTSGVFVNDTSGTENELYQYDGTALELTGNQVEAAIQIKTASFTAEAGIPYKVTGSTAITVTVPSNSGDRIAIVNASTAVVTVGSLGDLAASDSCVLYYDSSWLEYTNRLS